MQTTFPLHSPDFYAGDPYPAYRELRAMSPVCWNDVTKFWALLKYEDVRYVSSNPALFSSAKGITIPDPEMPSPVQEGNLIFSDPPRHRQLRKLINSGFTRRQVAHLEPKIREIVRGILDGLEPGSLHEFAEEIAAPLPTRLIAELIGAPPDDWEQFRAWSDAATGTADPEIELDLDFTDRLVDIVEEGLDVAIRTGTATDSRLKMRKLGTYSYVIVATPAYFDRRGVPEAPEDLLKHACLYHRWLATGKIERWIFRRDGAELDFAPPALLTASTMEPLIALTESDLGVMYTPTFTVRRQLLDGTLRSVLDPFLPATGSLQALWSASRHESPKVRAFVDFMARNLLAEKP